METNRKKTSGKSYYFGFWARCLEDEFKKKICNNCHVASSELVGGKSVTSAEKAQLHPVSRLTSDAEDRSDEKQTPPDRWALDRGSAFPIKASATTQHKS